MGSKTFKNLDEQIELLRQKGLIIDDEYYAKINFIAGTQALCNILTSEEYTKELKNPESDIHFITTD